MQNEQPKFELKKVFQRTQMPAEIKEALRQNWSFHNDSCISISLEYGSGYPDENNTVVNWLLENGAVEDDGDVLVDVSW